MRRRLGETRRWLLLGAALAAMALPAPAAAATIERPPGHPAFQMLLRLPELAPGYQIGDDWGCGPFGTEGADRGLEEWVLKYRPEGCILEYERIFRVAGHGTNPPQVDVFVLTTQSAEAADAGVAIAPELFRWVLGEERYRSAAPPIAIGEETWLFRTERANALGNHRPGSVILWRVGSLLAGVEVAGWSHAADERVAVHLASLQQAHIEAPTPYTAAELDDTEVELDNPRLRIPIYWLGARFAPGHGLGPLRLEEAFTGKPVGPPGEEAELWYEGGVALSSWSATEWRRVKRTSFGDDLLRRWKCTGSTRIRLPGGFADVFAAYGRDFDVCPHTKPNRFYAIAHLGRTVVGVNLALCDICFGPDGGPYNSVRGMKTVLRGLRVRPRPDY